MKKEKLFILLILLIIISNISAVQITINKESFFPRETLQSQISGNFISLTKENILIFKGEKVHSEPVIKDLIKFNNKYYFYAILPNEPGNFSIRIRNAQYLELGKTKTDDIIRYFKIQTTNSSYLSINPGIILTNDDFSVRVISINGNQDLTATLEASGETKTLNLVEESEDILRFSIGNIPAGTNALKLNEYSIPVFVIKNNEIIENITLNFIPSEIIDTLEDKPYSIRIAIENNGNKNLSNVYFSSDINASISPLSINLLEPGKRYYLNLTIISNKEIRGNIIATYLNNTFRLPIILRTKDSPNNTEIPPVIITTNNTNPQPNLNCNSIGKICLETQKCSGEVVPSLDGPCCKAECNDIKKNNSNWIYGLLLILIIGGLVAYWYFKVKRGSLKSSSDIFKEKSERFKERMKMSEVHGELDRF